MPNIGFTIRHLASFSLGLGQPKGHLFFNPTRASACLSVGPKWAACGATSGKLEAGFTRSLTYPVLP